MFKVTIMALGGKNYLTAIPPYILAEIAKYKLDKHGSTCPIAQRNAIASHWRNIAKGNAKFFKMGLYLPHQVWVSVDSPKLLKISKNGKVTLLLPETPDEIQKYAGMVEIIDGQHKTLSFHREYRECDIPDDYRLGVSVLYNYTDVEKVSCFKMLNTGAKTPDKDLLCQHNRYLNGDDKEFQHIYDLMEALNEIQPLKDCIRIGNSQERGKLISIASLCNSHLTSKNGVNLDEALIGMNCKTLDKKVAMMKKYLEAWINYVSGGANRFNVRDKKDRYSSKSYSIFALQFAAPFFEAMAKYNNRRWNEAKAKELFGIMKTVLGITNDISECQFKNSGAADRNRFARDTSRDFKDQVEAYFASKTAASGCANTANVAVVNNPFQGVNNPAKMPARKSTKVKV